MARGLRATGAAVLPVPEPSRTAGVVHGRIRHDHAAGRSVPAEPEGAERTGRSLGAGMVVRAAAGGLRHADGGAVEPLCAAGTVRRLRLHGGTAERQDRGVDGDRVLPGIGGHEECVAVVHPYQRNFVELAYPERPSGSQEGVGRGGALRPHLLDGPRPRGRAAGTAPATDVRAVQEPPAGRAEHERPRLGDRRRHPPVRRHRAHLGVQGDNRRARGWVPEGPHDADR